MDQLRFTGLHEDGAHLVVTAQDGTDYVVPVDDRLRAAVRGQAPRERSSVPVTPREVQAMIRAGQTAEEIAERTGWEARRVQRYESPILAEREHVAALARATQVRTHDRAGTPPTLESRALGRLEARGVPAEKVSWDATRPEGGRWTVVVTFVAGQRDRQASWTFDPAARSLDALDDEARWLSEDEVTLPQGAAASVFGGATDGPDDLMSSMRERSRKRGRSRRGPRAASEAASAAAVAPTVETATQGAGSADPGAVPGREEFPDEALPLEDFPYDPDTMGLPPSAHGHMDPEDGDAEARDDDAGYDGAEHVEETEDLVEGEDEVEELPAEDQEATLADFFDPRDDDYVEDDDLGPDDAGVADEAGPVDEGLGDDPPPTVESEDAGLSPRRRGRPSVPSWDDIMFGARDRGR